MDHMLYEVQLTNVLTCNPMAFWNWLSVMFTCRNCSTDSSFEWSTVSLMMTAPFELRRIISTAGRRTWHTRITAQDWKGMLLFKRSTVQSTPLQYWFVEQWKFSCAREAICCKISHVLVRDLHCSCDGGCICGGFWGDVRESREHGISLSWNTWHWH